MTISEDLKMYLEERRRMLLSEAASIERRLKGKPDETKRRDERIDPRAIRVYAGADNTRS